MHFFNELLPVSLLFLSQVSAAPLADVAELLKRDYTGFDGCTTAQKDKINAALSDAAVLARFVTVNHGDQTFRSSPAFKNYFQDVEDDTGVERMFAAIGVQATAPAPINGEPEGPVTLNQFRVHVTCQDPNNICKQKGTSSLAITDVSPVTDSFTPSIIFCPAFFDPKEPRTQNNLNSKTYQKNPGRRDPPSWCQTGEKFKFFEVAGHTLLHELTHLNEAGSRAGLAPHAADPDQPSGTQTQGTEDVNGMKGYSKDPMTAARQLRVNWQKILDAKPTPPEDTWPPFVEKLNAESYAAAALEWWFISQCDFPNILPN